MALAGPPDAHILLSTPPRDRLRGLEQICHCNTLTHRPLRRYNVRWCKITLMQNVRFRKIFGGICKVGWVLSCLLLRCTRYDRQPPADWLFMRPNNDSTPGQQEEEDLAFLDDRMQLLDTVRQMIDIELEQRGVTPQPPPLTEGRRPPDRKPHRRTLWRRLVRCFCRYRRKGQTTYHQPFNANRI